MGLKTCSYDTRFISTHPLKMYRLTIFYYAIARDLLVYKNSVWEKCILKMYCQLEMKNFETGYFEPLNNFLTTITCEIDYKSKHSNQKYV